MFRNDWEMQSRNYCSIIYNEKIRGKRYCPKCILLHKNKVSFVPWWHGLITSTSIWGLLSLFFFDSLDLSDLYYVVLTCGIFTMNRSIWLLTYNYSKWVCQNHCRFSKKVKESTVSLNWSLLLKLLNMTECHLTPRFLYMSRAGLIWPKFYIIPFLISKNASTSSLILKLLL